MPSAMAKNSSIALRRRRWKRRGVVLIASLWMLSILAFLAWNLVNRVRLDLALTDYRSDDLRAGMLVDAALARGLWALRQDDDPEIDHYGEAWGLAADLTEEGLLDPRGEDENPPIVNWEVEDEAGKLNVNLVDPVVLRSLFETYYGFDIEADSLAQYIVDWTDEDDEGLAERDYYESLSPSYAPRNGVFPYLEELLLVRGVTPELYREGVAEAGSDDAQDGLEDSGGAGDAGPRGLTHLLTVEGDGSLNVNTAPRQVLEAVFRTMTDVAEAARLARQLDERRRGEDGLFGTADDEPFLDENDLTDYIDQEFFDQAAAYGVLLGVRSGSYTIRATVRFDADRMERTGWARVRGSGENAEIISWRHARFGQIAG